MRLEIMWKDPESRKAVVVGLVSSALFVYFLHPILRFAWFIVGSLGNTVYRLLSDSTYQQAALNFDNGLLTQLVSYLVALLFGISMGQLYTLISRQRQPAKQSGKVSTAREISPWILPCLLFAMTLLMCIVLLQEFAVMTLTASFRQRLAILAPYLDEKEEELLLSDWASMKKGLDHENLVMKMNSMASNRGVLLPKPLWQ